MTTDHRKPGAPGTPVRKRNKGGKRGGGGATRGYKPGEVYLRPGSRTERAYAALVAEGEALQRALSLDEWRAAYERRYGEPLRRLDVVAFQLRKRGFIAVAGGRTGHLLYTPTACPQPAVNDDPHGLLVDVVMDACRETGQAVPMERIHEGLAARGMTYGSDTLRNMLELLSTTAPGRDVSEQVAARLECVTAQGAHWARARRFWRPVGSTVPAPVDAPASRAAALRAAVMEVTSQLGRPCSPVELKAWARAHRDHPIAAAAKTGSDHRGRFTGALRNLLSERAAGRGLVDVSHPLATRGGIPLRVAPQSVAQAELAAGRFADACAWLRPVEEMTSCTRLREEADEDGLPVLGELADVRERAMAGALMNALEQEGHRPDLADLTRRVTQAAERLTGWWRAGSRARYPGRARWVQDAEAAAESAQHLNELSRLARVPGMQLVLAGEGGLRPVEEVAEWLCAILRPAGRTFKSPEMHLESVRRFPNPQFVRGPLYDEAPEAFSLLDVGDVLLRLSHLATDGRIAVLLASAAGVLGSAVRDARLLHALLAELPPGETYHRHAALVALGALGMVVEPGVALADSYDRAGLDAYALAVGLSPGEPEERAERLAAVHELVAPSLHSWLDEICDRVRDGDTVTTPM
ncbi:MAG TPA: hypothetical protein VGE02_10240 [Gemmatimonadales bacterium]